MISEVREYFKTQIVGCLPSYVDVKDPFGDNDLPTVNFDKQYRVVIGSLSTQDRGNNYVEILQVRVDLFKKGFNKEQDGFDALYDSILELRTYILNPRAWNDNLYIKHIYSVDTIESPIADSNDNNMQASVNFEVLVTTAIITKDV